jgi:hypothetical protein
VNETLLKHLTSTKKTFNKMEKQTAVDLLICVLCGAIGSIITEKIYNYFKN